MFFNPPPHPLPKGEAAESDQAEMATNNKLSLSFGHLSLGVKGRRKRTPLLVETRTVDGTKWQIRAASHCTAQIIRKQRFSRMDSVPCGYGTNSGFKPDI